MYRLLVSNHNFVVDRFVHFYVWKLKKIGPCVLFFNARILYILLHAMFLQSLR